MDALLLGITFLPTLAALFIALGPKSKNRSDNSPFWIGLVASIVNLGLGIFLYANFRGENPNPEFVFDRAWFQISDVFVRFTLGVDGLSILLVVLTTLLMPIVLLIAPGHIHERKKEFVVWALIMETGMIGVFLALDLVLFYVFWELTLVPLYFIIGIWGGPRKLYATVKFFLYTLAGSLLMLVGVILLLGEAKTANLTQLAATNFSSSTQFWCFLLFAAAFAVKVPMVPFHTWLPDAHVEAPTGGSVILAGVLLKMGTYGFLRFCIPMFPQASLDVAPYFMALGAFGVVYGALLAWAQQDLKKLVAYSSVSHMGLIVVGLFALNHVALQGALIQMVNHGLSTGALFLLVGMIYERRHTRDIQEFGGIAKVMPLFALFFGIVTFSSIGLPGLNGFIGEFLLLLGSFQSNPWFAGFAALGVIFGAVYMLSALRRVLLGPITNEENESLKDLGAKESLAVIPLIVLIVWIGLAPKSFLQKSEASVSAITQRIEFAKEKK